MDTLIQKIDILQIPSLIEVLKYNGPLFIFLIIFVNIGILLTAIVDETQINFTEVILMMLVVTGIILTVGYNHYPKEHYTNLKLTQLNEIQNLIHVKDNKLTIDKLPEYYKYTNDKYNKNETQVFKIEHDEFFNTYKLVDKNNNITKITNEEYEKLTKDGNK